jgi:hypothetical protein
MTDPETTGRRCESSPPHCRRAHEPLSKAAPWRAKTPPELMEHRSHISTVSSSPCSIECCTYRMNYMIPVLSCGTPQSAFPSLELERSHHLAALNAGLVVEKAPVTTSLNGLMRTRDRGGCSAWPGENCTSGAEALKKTSTVSVRVSLIKRTMVAEVQLNQATRERKVPPGHAGPDTVSPGRKRCC